MTLLLQPDTTLDEETAMAYTLPLDHPEATLDNVGGKGASLARLMQAGMPVPDGFHVTTAAYRRFVQDNALQPVIAEALQSVDAAQPDTLETASNIIRLKFLQGRMSAEIAAAIAQSYAALGEDAAVAVRSSATAEDLPDLSFAGQQDSFLNVRGIATVQETVKHCWASLWTARAIGYRAQHNIDHNAVSLAVVVQQLVNAEAAGVLFTANPINGRRDQAVINAAWGLGEAIVGGLVTPDTIVVEKASGKVIERHTADKLVMVVRSARGTIEQAVPDRLRQAAVLSDQQAAQLVQLGVQIDELYGMPMDIEWVLLPSPAGRGAGGEGEFAIVQARPITALPPEPVQWIPPNPKGMYARGSLCEHLPNPVSPLFGTLGIRMVNLPTKEIGEMALGVGGGDYQYRIINGYVYLGMVLSWREWLAMSKASTTLMRSMFKISHEHWQAGRTELIAAIAAQDAKDVAALSPTALLDSARELLRAIGKFYTVIQASTLPSATSSEAIFARLYKLVSRKDDPKAETLLFGLETTPLRAEKSLFDLGWWTRERPALRDFTLHTPTAELVAALQDDAAPQTIPAEDWREFKHRFEKYLAEFGHTTYEFDFMNPTPAETPAVILAALKLYVDGKGSDPYARQRESTRQREETLQKIRSRFKLIPNRWFNKAVNWALRVGPDREDSIADLGMGHTTLRRMLGELGQRFVAHGALKNAEDIYWLVEDEVSELASRLERDEQLPDYSGVHPRTQSRLA